MAQVAVSKGLLLGLAGVAAASLLGLVFLLGRVSAPSAAPEHLAPPAASLAVTPPTLPPTLPPAPDPAAPPGMPASPALAAAPAPPRPLEPLPPAKATPTGDTDRAAVQAYFKAVDNAQPQRDGNPETTAQQIMAGFGKGDTSDFEAMIQQAQTTRDRLAGLSVPGPCADFHRESLANLDAGLGLMREIKQAITATDPSAAATDLVGRATALKARSEALQAKEQALRQRYR